MYKIWLFNITRKNMTHSPLIFFNPLDKIKGKGEYLLVE